MSARTPGLQPRSQYHSYWGQFVWNAAGSDAGAANLPNDTANPLPNPEFSKLETGDIASTTDGAVDANIGLWVCYDVGTVSGSDAKWRRLDNNAVITQTIRDAHVIVVGQTGAAGPLDTVFAPGTPPPASRLNLDANGDVLAVTVDFLDVGDGVELALALAVPVAAGGANIDIRLRPCNISLGVAVAPLAVPANTRLIGAGRLSSKITGRDGTGATTQCVFTLASNASIEDLQIASPKPVAAPGGAEEGVVQITSGNARVLRCNMLVDGATGVGLARVAVAAIRAPSPAFVVVDDCELTVQSLFNQNVPAISYGVWMGTLGSDPRFAVLDSEVLNTSILGVGALGGSAQRAVRFENMEGGRAFNCDHVNAENAESFSWAWDLGPAFPGDAVPTRGCSFIECRVTTKAIAGQTPGDTASQTGFTIEVLAGAKVPAGWSDFKIHDCEVVFRGDANTSSFVRTGYLLKNSIPSDDGNPPLTEIRLANVTFDNCKAQAAHKGFRINGLGDGLLSTGEIHSVKLTACQAKDMNPTGPSDQEGLLIEGSLITPVNVFNVGAVNCDFSGVGSGANNSSVKIANANAKDTLIGFNSLTPNGTAIAISDAGTGTEAAHNILA